MTIKQKIIGLTLLMLSTFIIWYFIISFVEMDISWIKRLINSSNTSRSLFVLGVVVKTFIDMWIWGYIKSRYFSKYSSEDKKLEDKEREKLRKTFN